MVSRLQDSERSTEKGKSEAALRWRAALFVAEIGGRIRSGRGKEGALGLRQLDAVAGNWLLLSAAEPCPAERIQPAGSLQRHAHLLRAICGTGKWSY